MAETVILPTRRALERFLNHKGVYTDRSSISPQATYGTHAGPSTPEQATSAFVMAGTQRTDRIQSSSTHEPPAAVSQTRLGIPSVIRITYSVLGAALTGMFLGLSHGSTMAGMVFRAENAHRFPTTQKGWYLYHKSKNYHSMLGGLKDGLKMARKLSFLSASFFAAEAIVDGARGNKDFASTAIAGSVVAGGFSALSTFLDRSAFDQ